jgi:hypothetical protein
MGEREGGDKEKNLQFNLNFKTKTHTRGQSPWSRIVCSKKNVEKNALMKFVKKCFVLKIEIFLIKICSF